MTDAELRAFVAQTRAEVQAKLDRLDALDWSAMPARIRAEMEAVRQECLDFLAILTDEAIDAELEASEHAGRRLLPAEIGCLVRKH